MMELLEMILIEVVEKAARSDRMPRDVQIVNVSVPVRAYFVDGGHGRNYTIAGSMAHSGSEPPVGD